MTGPYWVVIIIKLNHDATLDKIEPEFDFVVIRQRNKFETLGRNWAELGIETVYYKLDNVTDLCFINWPFGLYPLLFLYHYLLHLRT